MSEPKTIYCPTCSRVVAHWDRKSSIDVVSQCRNCGKKIIYRVETGITEVKEKSQRKNSSGLNLSS